MKSKSELAHELHLRFNKNAVKLANELSNDFSMFMTEFKKLRQEYESDMATIGYITMESY